MTPEPRRRFRRRAILAALMGGLLTVGVAPGRSLGAAASHPLARPRPLIGIALPPPVDGVGLRPPAARAARTAGLPAADTRFGAFAGENWRARDPRSISATWVAPRLLRSALTAVGGTWIGIQGPDHGNRPGAFIQVGINEEPDGDYAFLSDTDLDYHPIFLFPIRAGDRIRASLRHVGYRWIVYIVDATHHRHSRQVTSDEGRGSFNQAEWLQEDVSGGPTQTPLPYPHLTPIRFTHLRVDGQAPAPGRLLAAWMNENGEFLGPDPVRGNGFTLEPQTISPLGAQYLKIVGPFNQVEDWFDGQSARWSKTTPQVEVDAECGALAQALEQDIAGLDGASWPTQLTPLVAALTGGDQGEINYLQTPPDVAVASPPTWIAGLFKAGANGDAALKIRRQLGLPTEFP